MRLNRDQWATVDSIRRREADAIVDFAPDHPPCVHCNANAPHHTVGETGISDSGRRTVWDVHEVKDSGGVGLAECTTPRAAATRAEKARRYKFHEWIVRDLHRTLCWHVAQMKALAPYVPDHEYYTDSLP